MKLKRLTILSDRKMTFQKTFRHTGQNKLDTGNEFSRQKCLQFCVIHYRKCYYERHMQRNRSEGNILQLFEGYARSCKHTIFFREKLDATILLHAVSVFFFFQFAHDPGRKIIVCIFLPFCYHLYPHVCVSRRARACVCHAVQKNHHHHQSFVSLRICLHYEHPLAPSST